MEIEQGERAFRRLSGKVAIIAGGSTGIGETISHQFSSEGAYVLVTGLPEDPVAEVVEAIHASGGIAVGYAGDLSDELVARDCIEHAIDEFGRIDVLVNHADRPLFSGETQDYPVDLFDQTMLDTVRSTFLMTKYALPHLRESRGNIVSAGSETGKLGLAMNTPYGGTKAWIHAFMRGVAAEQARYGVRANCVCPGPIDTAWTHRESNSTYRALEEGLLNVTSLARRGTPDEVAKVYAFLASDEASSVTGALFSVDGGISLGSGAGATAPLRTDTSRLPEIAPLRAAESA